MFVCTVIVIQLKCRLYNSLCKLCRLSVCVCMWIGVCSKFCLCRSRGQRLQTDGRLQMLHQAYAKCTAGTSETGPGMSTHLTSPHISSLFSLRRQATELTTWPQGKVHAHTSGPVIFQETYAGQFPVTTYRYSHWHDDMPNHLGWSILQKFTFCVCMIRNFWQYSASMME